MSIANNSMLIVLETLSKYIVSKTIYTVTFHRKLNVVLSPENKKIMWLLTGIFFGLCDKSFICRHSYMFCQSMYMCMCASFTSAFCVFHVLTWHSTFYKDEESFQATFGCFCRLSASFCVQVWLLFGRHWRVLHFFRQPDYIWVFGE
jgi:hypothetical protein